MLSPKKAPPQLQLHAESKPRRIPSRSLREWFEWDRGGSMDAITLAEVIAWSDACLDVPQDQWPAVEALHATYRRTVNLAGAESAPKPSTR